jgi:hypothetical protein
MTLEPLSMNNDFPCICGHAKYLHVQLAKGITEQQNKCFLEKDTFYNFCICGKFQGDNLKYLQDKHDK